MTPQTVNLRVDQEVSISQVPVTGPDWPALCAAMARDSKWTSETVLMIYVESVSHCGFEPCTGKDDLARWECPADAFQGRAFGGMADARWVRRDDGMFQAWIVREDARSSDHNPTVTERKYFLLGRGTSEKGVFEEARYPRTFRYPVDAVQTKSPQDARAFVLVAEYEPCMPVWSVDRSEEETGAELDQPMLAAHRFVRLDTSDGSKKDSNG